MDVHTPSKRKYDLVAGRPDNIRQWLRPNITSRESGQSSINESEPDEGEILENFNASSRTTSPRPATKGHPSASRDQHLCESCSSIDFNEIRPGPGLWKTTALKLGTLSQFTIDANCLLCQLFVSMASLAYAPTRSDSQTIDEITFYLCSFHTSAMYSHNWRDSRTIRGLQKSVSFAVVDEHVLHDINGSFSKERKMSHDLWPSRTSIERSGWLSPAHIGEEQKFAGRILKSHADLDIARKWLDFCLENHGGNCEPTDTRPIPALRVVDCNTGLIVAVSSNCKYLAMSYVWGTASNSSKELAEGETLLAPSTPILIRDAISATKKMGYQYLWIDRYCIPQEDGKERHSQIQQMDLIYSKAQATIFAISSRDPEQGLPGIGERKRAASVTMKIGGVMYVYIPPHPMVEILGSVWNSRGWTHQETILSRRRVFFCKHQIYFECAGMRCYDTMAAPLKLLHTKDLRMFSKWNRPSLFARVRQTKDPLTAVFDQVIVYTGRSLTRPDDILNGIMGTFHAFESIYDSFRHYWGVIMVPDITYRSLEEPNPRKSTRTEQFLTGLCWQLSRPGQRRQSFPSWSWSGFYGSLKHCEENGYIKNTHRVKIWIDSIFTSQMDLGTFCDTNSIDLFPSNPEPFIVIEADFFPIQVRLAIRESVGENIETKWQAVLGDGDRKPFYAPFHITRHISLSDESYSQTLKLTLSAFVLGDRLRTRYHPSTKRKLLSKDSPTTILVVVEELKSGIIERVGLIELEDSENKMRLEAISKRRRRCKYG